MILSGMALSALLNFANFPAALLLGPVIASTIFGIRGASVRMPVILHRMAQGIAGCLIARYMSPEIMAGILEHWAAVTAFVALTFLISCLVGWTLGRLAHFDEEVTIWGFLPGMAGTMIAMAHERGLDSRIVAFIQILRVVAVILGVSMLSRVISADAPAALGDSGPVTTIGLILTPVFCLIAVLSGRYLTFIPAGATLVPLLLASVLHFAGLPAPALPAWLLPFSYLILGCQVGLRFTPSMVRSIAQSFFLILGGIVALLFMCGLSGALLAEIVGESLITGILATVPGSVETVALIAVNTHANLSFVMTLQVVRLFAVVLAGPWIAKWMTAHLTGARA
nr:AbrB family transcriptional regulator [Pseudoruegeria sp. HB172150]